MSRYTSKVSRFKVSAYSDKDALRILHRVKYRLLNDVAFMFDPSGRWPAIATVGRAYIDIKYGQKCIICLRRVDRRYCQECERTHNLPKLETS